MNDYDCEQCTDTTKRMRGCESGDTAMEGYIIGEKIYSRCPKALFNQFSRDDRVLINELMTTYFYLNKSILPYSGGWKDQDMSIMNFMPTIHSLVEKELLRKSKN